MEIKNELEKENEKVRLGHWILEEDSDSWKWIIDKEKLIDEIIKEVYRRG